MRYEQHYIPICVPYALPFRCLIEALLKHNETDARVACQAIKKAKRVEADPVIRSSTPPPDGPVAVSDSSDSETDASQAIKKAKRVEADLVIRPPPPPPDGRIVVSDSSDSD